MIGGVRRLLIGAPLPTVAGRRERLSKSRAIGAFGLDALSSVAYGPDEILYVLLLAGAVGTRLDLPIALAITALLAIVAVSYRQTIFAYPHGGGSYTVARRNLGLRPGLLAAAALIVDYITTVAVSVTAGVQAIVAFLPALDEHRVVASVAAILLLVFINLRGVREAGAAFVIPTYAFILSLAALLGWGLLRFAVLGEPPPLHAVPPAVEGLSLVLVLRAFAGGCTAMTGVEAIANGVPVFEKPEPRNAAATLLLLAVLLGALFLGVATLGNLIGAVPSEQANVIAQIGLAVAPNGPLFYLVQLSAAVILLLAANTPFNGFPLLAAILAEDDFLPHQFAHRGARLAFSNGIIVIGVLAAVLVLIFHGSTHALIPLFAIGVFLCFTLSQAGMVVHWLRRREDGWRWKLVVNGVGAVITGLVTLVVLAAKFTEGAWVVLILVPLLVGRFASIHRAYRRERREVAVHGPLQVSPGRHLVLIPVGQIDRSVAETLEYALGGDRDVTVVHVAFSPEEGRAFEERWRAWAPGVPLRVIQSPYREVVGPLMGVVDELLRVAPDHRVMVMIPDVVPAHWYDEPLHNQLGLAIAAALRARAGVAFTLVPVHLN